MFPRGFGHKLLSVLGAKLLRTLSTRDPGSPVCNACRITLAPPFESLGGKQTPSLNTYGNGIEGKSLRAHEDSNLGQRFWRPSFYH